MFISLCRTILLPSLVLLLAASVSASSSPLYAGERKPLASLGETTSALGDTASAHKSALVPPPTLVTEPHGGSSYAVPYEKEITIPMKWAVASGILLAFNSGYANGVCLSGAIVAGTKQAVAAVTGAWTTSALGYANGNMDQFRNQMGMILSYMGGSAIAGLLNPNPSAFKLSSSVGPAFLLCSALMYTSSNMASKGMTDMTIFFLAAIANGIQNSITSVHTGNLVRSAHYSGMTSDMGTFIGQVLRGNKQNLLRLKVSAALAASFFAGGATSVFTFKENASASLLASAILYAALGLVVMYLKL